MQIDTHRKYQNFEVKIKKKKKKKTKFELIYRTVEFFANYAPANRKLYGEIIFYNFVKKNGLRRNLLYIFA